MATPISASAHQPIRVSGTVYHKHGFQRLVQIREHAAVEVDLADFAERVAEMPPLPGVGMASGATATTQKLLLDAVLTTPVREGAVDDWSCFQGASAAIGHFIRLVHEGRLAPSEVGSDLRLQRRHAPAALAARPAAGGSRAALDAAPRTLRPAAHSYGARRVGGGAAPHLQLGALLDDTSPMPEDIIGPRVLTPGGLLVLGGAPKVGKSDFLISWFVHMAAGAPFLGFAPPPLRVFHLQAEIQYHYLRERMQAIRLDPEVIAGARDLRGDAEAEAPA